jgi:hypothetical protein
VTALTTQSMPVVKHSHQERPPCHVTSHWGLDARKPRLRISPSVTGTYNSAAMDSRPMKSAAGERVTPPPELVTAPTFPKGNVKAALLGAECNACPAWHHATGCDNNSNSLCSWRA